jgi:hypothetical protein
VFRATSVEDAARSSDAVVRGKVERRTARLTADRSKIVTDVQIAVSSAWKGDPGRSVTVTVPGGKVGDLGMWVDAAPTFDDGEEVVVFLARRAAEWHVNGLALGKLRVDGAAAVPGVAKEDVKPSALRAGEASLDAPISLGELERRVRAAR